MSEDNVQIRGELICPICKNEYEVFNRETVTGDFSYNYCMICRRHFKIIEEKKRKEKIEKTNVCRDPGVPIKSNKSTGVQIVESTDEDRYKISSLEKMDVRRSQKKSKNFYKISARKDKTFPKEKPFWSGLSARDSYSTNRDSYSTIDLIADLRSELRNFPRALAQIFPERVENFSQIMLSEFWGHRSNYVSNQKTLLNNDSNYKISDRALNDLIYKITKLSIGSKNGDQKVLNALNLINAYDDREIDMITFFIEIRYELGRISPEINVINKELSVLFGMWEGYIKDLNQKISNPSDSDYNPDFGFSLEQLDYLEKILSLLIGNDAQKLLRLLKSYRLANPNLKRYQSQQFTIENPDFFHEIDSAKKGYWLGFLCADGYHNREQYLTQFELQRRDKERLVAFSREIGYDPVRIHDRSRFLDIDGKLTWVESSYMVFSAKPLSKDLMDHGFFEFKDGGMMPHVITQLVDAAYAQSNDLSDTIEGRIALSFLLGFYDGDGSKTGRSGYIASNKKLFLLQVKNLFKVPIKNQVFPIIKRKIDSETGKMIEYECFGLTLGTDLMSQLMKVFLDSMERKRTE